MTFKYHTINLRCATAYKLTRGYATKDKNKEIKITKFSVSDICLETFNKMIYGIHNWFFIFFILNF